MKLTKADLIKIFGSAKTLQHKLYSIKASQVILITAKNVGKNTFCDFLKIISFEINILSNTLTGRRTEASSSKNLRNEFLKNLGFFKLLLPKVKSEYVVTAQKIARITYKKDKDKLKNQSDLMFSYDNLDKISGYTAGNGGNFRITIFDELVSLDNIKPNGRLISDNVVTSNELIIESTVDRTVNNAWRKFSLLLKLYKKLKYNKDERKCEGCRLKTCFGFYNTPKTKYKNKICKKKLELLKEVKKTLSQIDTKEFKSQMFFLMNPWDERFYYVRQLLFRIPLKRWVSFIFPKCFNYNYFLEKYSDSDNKELWIDEVSNAFDKNRDKIFKHLFAHTHLLKYDKNKDTMYAIATVFANHTLFWKQNQESLKKHMRQVENAIKSVDRKRLASSLGIPNNYIDIRGTTYKTGKWIFVRDFEKLLQKLLAKDKVVSIKFGIDVDYRRRFMVSPTLSFKDEIELENNRFLTIEKEIVLPQKEFEIFDLKKGYKDETYCKKIFAYIENFILKYSLNQKYIEKYIITDINASNFALILEELFVKKYGYEFLEWCQRVPAVVGDMQNSKSKTGWGIICRQVLLQEAADSGIIIFVICNENQELIETFRNIPSDSNGKRLEKSDLSISGFNWERRMDTINSVELSLWSKRYTIYDNVIEMGANEFRIKRR